MKTKRRNSGLTLVEVLVATAILGGVVWIVMHSLFTTTSASTKGMIASDLEARGRNFVDTMKLEFATARFRDPLNVMTLGIYQNNTEIHYQIPVQSDPQLYGYTALLGRDDASTADWAAYVRFEPQELIVESGGSGTLTLPTATNPLPAYEVPTVTNVDFDVNRDADELDTFALGRIVLYTVKDDGMGGFEINDDGAAGPTQSILSENVILAVGGTGALDGDIDGLAATPAQDNLLFRYVDASGTTVVSPTPGTASRGIVISIWHGNWDDLRKGLMLRHSSEGIRFRNIQ